MNKEIFILLGKDVAEIQSSTITEDPGVGGTKLVYRRKVYKMHKTWFGRITGWKPTEDEVMIFFRPFQKIWDTRRNRLSRNDWGKGPLTNLWLILEKDFGYMTDKTVPVWKDKVKNHVLIKFLRENPPVEKFYFYT